MVFARCFVAVAAIGAGLLSFEALAQAPRVYIDAGAIGGVVTSRFGPETGAWVIAETMDVGTRSANFVVSDDFGRHVIADLPKASYSVWARGYGLVDSKTIAAEPKGRSLWATSGNRIPYHIEAFDAPGAGAPGMTPAAYSSRSS